MLNFSQSRRTLRDRRVEQTAAAVPDRRRAGSDRRRSLRSFGLGCLCLGLAAPASAQIYSWKDASGHLVVSNRPQGLAAYAYAVPKTEAIRATRPAVSERSRAYDDLIDEHSRRQSVRSDLVRAVVQVESGFNPYATSPKGAQGLMQLMPATARRFGVVNAFNPVENVRAGVAYLRQLLDRYQNNETLALAAYNAGPAAVDRHGQNVPPFRETQNYVSRISGMAGRSVQAIGNKIYRTTEMVNGREVQRYTDRRPATGAYDLVPAR
jgi:hypothetical protein